MVSLTSVCLYYEHETEYALSYSQLFRKYYVPHSHLTQLLFHPYCMPYRTSP